MRIFWAVGLILLFASVWLYSEYEDYNARDDFRMHVNLIPHDITAMAAVQKQLVDVKAEFALSLQKLQRTVQQLSAVRARNARWERCSERREDYIFYSETHLQRWLKENGCSEFFAEFEPYIVRR